MICREKVCAIVKREKIQVHDALYYHFYENQEHKVAKHIGVRTDGIN